jgi:hypothetical protein
MFFYPKKKKMLFLKNARTAGRTRVRRTSPARAGISRALGAPQRWAAFFRPFVRSCGFPEGLWCFVFYTQDPSAHCTCTPAGALEAPVKDENRGAGKKKIDEPPRAFAKSQTPHPPSDIFFFDFNVFLGVSRQGKFKNTIQIFLQKVHVENFSQKNRQNFRCQFFLDFFCFIAFSGVSQRWGSKTHTKKGFSKNIVSKSFHKKIDQKSKTDVFSIFFITFLGVSWEFQCTVRRRRFPVGPRQGVSKASCIS